MLILPAFIRKAKEKLYKGPGFQFSYPPNWECVQENGIITVYPTENYGTLSIVRYENITAPESETPALLAEIQGLPPDAVNFLIMPKGTHTEYYQEYKRASAQWAVKAFRRGQELQVITIHCSISHWEAQRNIFLKTMHSFSLTW